VKWALLLLVGCGGGFSDKDATSLADAVNLNLQADKLLDGGPARALERGALCSTESVLYSHKKPVPISDIKCQAP
jgi:hypothetical protein